MFPAVARGKHRGGWAGLRAALREAGLPNTLGRTTCPQEARPFRRVPDPDSRALRPDRGRPRGRGRRGFATRPELPTAFRQPRPAAAAGPFLSAFPFFSSLRPSRTEPWGMRDATNQPRH